MKKTIPLILSALFLLTSCSPQTDLEQDLTIEGNIAGRATVAPDPVTTAELTDEEVIEKMPEIVFVYEGWSGGSLYWGLYVTKNGNIKSYNFKSGQQNINNYNLTSLVSLYIADDKVGLHNLNIDSYNFLFEVADDTDVAPIAITDLEILYETLIGLNWEESRLLPIGKPRNWVDEFTMTGEEFYEYRIYGIRFNKIDEYEIIALGGEGVQFYENTNPIAHYLYGQLTRVIPHPDSIK